MKVQKRHIPIFLSLLVTLPCFAQSTLIINHQEPIAHAAVRVVDLEDGGTSYYTSDENGQVEISQVPPYQVFVSHLNYQSVSDTIHQNGEQYIQLSPSDKILDDVVVTGQFVPQSLRQSVYNIRVVDHERLATQGVQSLTDVLAYELNFRFQRDNAVGNSNASLQGISGQNIKVLLDGVPMVGRSGVSNEVDLNQININSIEKIEIVEGPMAVSYGADALAGVINIITKTNALQQWSMDVLLQEETVGREYALLDEGIHNLSLNGSYRFNSRWSLRSESRIYKFGGWAGSDTTRNERDKLWYPKTQFFQSGVLRYETDQLDIYYRLDFMDETLENKGAPELVDEDEDPYAFDKEYLTSRWMHQVQADYRLNQGTLNTVLSYTDYDRITHRFRSFLIPGVSDITTTDGQDSISFHTLFFRSTLNSVLHGSLGETTWQTQLGVDGNFETASGTTLSAGDKTLNNLGFFASIELALGQNLKIRPGVRYTYNSIFSTSPSASVNLKYDLQEGTQIRLSYGRGFRAPSLRELYHEFIDANHNILGNEDLEPEYSNNINGDFTHQFKNQRWLLTASGFYNDINNRISFFTPDDPTQGTTYINVRNFKTLGSTGTVTYSIDQLKIKAGVSYIGRYHSFSEEASTLDVPKFLYSPEFTTSIQWELFQTGISLASFYKLTGPSKQYADNAENGNSPTLELRQRDSFHFWDLTLTKTLTAGLTLGLGGKNILDVTAVNNTANSGGAHSGSSNGQSSIAYGRSFFLKLNYNFSK